MGLKQSIVIKNEYTNNANSAPGKGSRGASPGQYVMRYMAREDATEVLAPVRVQDNDMHGFIRYMMRDSATEQLKQSPDVSVLELKHRFRHVDKQSGRAFGSDGLSLSHEELTGASESIQSAFDDGHSVQKIVLSFTEDYLRETGVIDETFTHKGRGSYKGQLDQLKLRQAITEGMTALTREGQYEDPLWVGTVQLDTSHVHAHIALVDQAFSDARMMTDGADRGKITAREKHQCRKGIHAALDDMVDLKHYNKQTMLERQNVVGYVKAYSYDRLHTHTSLQLLMASLPKQKQHWRYGTNRKSMQHSNDLAKTYVEDLFTRDPEGTGYTRAMASIDRYATAYQQLHGSTDRETDTVREEGYRRLIERSVNGLYDELKQVDNRTRLVRTPMIDVQASSDDDLSHALMSSEQGDDLTGFELRVRGYKYREATHKQQAQTFHDLSSEFDTAYDEGFVDHTALVMRQFYEEERLYHMKLVDKYRYFFPYQNKDDVAKQQRHLPTYTQLVDDFHTLNREDRVEVADYQREVRQYTFDCFMDGLATSREWEAVTASHREGSVSTDTPLVLPFEPRPRQELLDAALFNDVKALDIHHLGLDFYGKDGTVSDRNKQAFVNATHMRASFADGAEHYVTSTGQSLDVLDEARLDIEAMRRVIDEVNATGFVPTVDPVVLSHQTERYYDTIPVDYDPVDPKTLHDVTLSVNDDDFWRDFD